MGEIALQDRGSIDASLGRTHEVIEYRGALSSTPEQRNRH
jgi:hypothetical protein